MLTLIGDSVASFREYEGTSYQGNEALKKHIVERRTRNQWEGLSSGLYCPRLQ